MSATRLIDTNVLIRYLTQDDPAKAALGRAVLERVSRGDEQAAISHLVVFEVVFLLQKTYRIPRHSIRQMVTALLVMPNMHIPDRQLLLDALVIYEQENISYADAFNAVYMRGEGMTELYSWDAEFDRLPWLIRFEPFA